MKKAIYTTTVLLIVLLAATGCDLFGDSPTNPGTTDPTMSDGTMEPIGGSGVAANIDVNPNSGGEGTQLTITVTFTSGASQVTGIDVYSFSNVAGWNTPVHETAINLVKTSNTAWLQQGSLYYTDSRQAVLRFYAHTSGGQLVAVGDVDKNGGGPAASWQNDGIN